MKDRGNRNYRNIFMEYGYSEQEVILKVEQTFFQIFYGEDRFFHLCEDPSMGYLEDTGNNDARTEGMSYGMMMCVQLDRKKEFDCLWKFAKTYMYMDKGVNKGYFAWSVSTDGTKNAYGPAPDGEEYFAMALIFASHRWGDGEGIFCYSKEARQLLHTCIHKGEDFVGRAMWDRNNFLIRFIPECDFTDPSYHLPHFYELFADFLEGEDSMFFQKAAMASRKYLMKACNPMTGLSAEYSTFDGTPYSGDQEIFGRHDWYYSDAYRTIANISMDYIWFMRGTEYGDWCRHTAENLQKFFTVTMQEHDRGIYSVDGEILEGNAIHPVAITAVNAQASLASEGPYAKICVDRFFHTEMRTGKRRYYDNCLYMFAVLALSGNYRIW